MCSTDLDELNSFIFGKGGMVLGSGQFSTLPQLPQKMKLASKVTQKYSSHFVSLIRDILGIMFTFLRHQKNLENKMLLRLNATSRSHMHFQKLVGKTKVVFDSQGKNAMQ